MVTVWGEGGRDLSISPTASVTLAYLCMSRARAMVQMHRCELGAAMNVHMYMHMARLELVYLHQCLVPALTLG